jgi:hypothetical protein
LDRNIKWKGIVYLINGIGKLAIHMRKNEIRPLFTPYSTIKENELELKIRWRKTHQHWFREKILWLCS